MRFFVGLLVFEMLWEVKTMVEKKLLVITEGTTDLLMVLTQTGLPMKVIRPQEISDTNLQDYYSIAILGGAVDKPIVLHPRDRIQVDAFIDRGGKVFCEYILSISDIYSSAPVTTKYERLVFCSDSDSISGLEQGDILDEQCNLRVKPYYQSSGAIPILQYAKSLKAHCRTKLTDDIKNNLENRALWLDKPNLLLCSFRISNFIKARFAPREKWIAIIRYIIEWLYDEKVSLDNIYSRYWIKGLDIKDNWKEHLNSCIKDAINWFTDAGILLQDGKMGVREGIGSEIYPDGNQQMLESIRADCIGEVSMAFFFYYLYTGNDKYLDISDNLTKAVFDYFQIKDGPYKGMIRWSDVGWSVCYQDDVARAILPYLFKCLYMSNSQYADKYTSTYLDDCIAALDFLISTTGTDGLRVQRTETINLTPEKMEELKNTTGNFPSAHYNGYYLAALMLAYKLTGIEKYREIGIKGMESIIKAYPDTIREHSQTQELCRLVMPSAFLYWVTGQEEHKEFLYKVVQDLQKMKHPSGAYLEWDEGYKAKLSRNEQGECSLLTENGDPVVDMLYSINWLPMGFIQAYIITKDPLFKNLWEDIARFMASVQIHSDDKKINGGWTRAFDVERMEVYANPYDIGWGPWSIESGWTVAEIVSGLIAGCI
jgi:hypothetical protein